MLYVCVNKAGAQLLYIAKSALFVQHQGKGSKIKLIIFAEFPLTSYMDADRILST